MSLSRNDRFGKQRGIMRVVLLLALVLMIAVPSVSVQAASAKKTGFVTVKKKTYYFDESGNKQYGFLKLKGTDGKQHWYYFNEKTGVMQTGLQYIKKKNIVAYFNDKGIMVTGKKKIDGQVMQFNKKTGALLGVTAAIDKKANTQLNEVNRKLKKAYEWSRTITYRPYKVSRKKSIAFYAKYGFNTGTGNCYVQAAVFAAMARQLGYQVKVIGGYMKTLNGKQDHAWCEIYYKGKWRICDPSFGQRRGKGYGWMINEGQKGTLQYLDDRVELK